MRNKVFLIILALFLCWVYFSLPKLGLYANDGGAKYIQMKGFYLNHWKKLDIEYPGAKIGLDFGFLNPTRFFIVKKNLLFCSYDPLFTFLSSIFFPFLGDRVIHFLPLASFFISFLILADTLKMVMNKGWFYDALLAVFLTASPILLYCVTFWEHLPAILLLVAGLHFITSYFQRKADRSNLFRGSFLVGSGIFFRTEMIFFIIAYAFLMTWILYRRKEIRGIPPVAGGLSLPVCLYAIFNFTFYGDILGLHAAYHLPNNFSIFQIGVCLAGLAMAFLALTFVARSTDKEPLSRISHLAFIFWLAIILLAFRNSPVPAFFWLFPLLFAVFSEANKTIERTFNPRPGLEELIFATLIAYISLIAIFLNHNPDPSERYLLPVVPLAIIFLGLNSERILKVKPLAVIICILIAMTAFLNISELNNRILHFKLMNARRIVFLKEHTREGDVVVFDANPLMEHYGPLFFERIYVVKKNSQTPGNILQALKDRGVKQCYYLTLDSNLSRMLMAKKNEIFKECRFSYKRAGVNYLLGIDLTKF